MDDKKFYVYVYLNPLKRGCYVFDGLDMSFLYEPFYVGVGFNKRYIKHLQNVELDNGANKLKINKIKKILNSGVSKNKIKDFIVFYKKNITKIKSLEIEKYLIKIIGKMSNGGTLTNLTDGGDGGQTGIIPWNKNKKCPIISKKLKGRIPWNKNKTGIYSKDTLYKMSIAKKGNPSPLKGIKNKKISEFLRIDIPTSDIDNIIKLYLKMGVPDIVKKTKYSRSIIERVLKENNIKKRSRGETMLLKWNFIKDDVIGMYRNGYSLRKILLALRDKNIKLNTTSTIKNILKNEGLYDTIRIRKK